MLTSLIGVCRRQCTPSSDRAASRGRTGGDGVGLFVATFRHDRRHGRTDLDEARVAAKRTGIRSGFPVASEAHRRGDRRRDSGTQRECGRATGRGAASKPTLFKSVRRPDGGPFFDRNGLLFLPPDKVKETLEGLLRSQFLLATLAADPSLRGVLATIQATLQGVRYGQARLGDIEPLMSALAATFDKALAGEAAYFSWQPLIAAQSVGEPVGRLQTHGASCWSSR